MFLPLLAERFANERLTALAQSDGKQHSRQPVVLFLCLGNASRSQMALGSFRSYAGDRALGFSGGVEPGREVEPEAIAAMAERGIDIGDEFPKPWTDGSSRPRTSSSRWAAAVPAPCTPTSATRSGPSTTPRGSSLPGCAPSATRSSDASYAYSRSCTLPLPSDPGILRWATGPGPPYRLVTHQQRPAAYGYAHHAVTVLRPSGGVGA
jgi:hypothetical protein